MFESLGYSKSLNEDEFNSWLEKGRESKLGYYYLLVMWCDWDKEFKPIYCTDSDSLKSRIDSSSDDFIAAYDLYSESMISVR